jgi:hypothetical protein
MTTLTFKPGAWDKICWGKPDSPQRPLCACCHGALPAVPLMVWRGDGSCIPLCDKCVEDLVMVQT